MLYLRNKQTGEIKEVTPDSPEFIVLKGQVGPDGRSLWEQTGDHAVDAIAERAEAGALTEEDLGHRDQPLAPIVVDTSNVQTVHEPWKDLTPAEREAGLDEDSKAEQVSSDIEAAQMDARESTLQEAAEAIKDSAPDGFPITASEVSDDASKDDLKAAAEARGLPTSGSKDAIRARIEDHDNAGATA